MENQNYKKRKTIRLLNYDYSKNGAYFVTICIKEKQNLLGAIVENLDVSSIQLSKIGTIVAAEIDKLSAIYHGVFLDCFVIMPNHIHMIIFIENLNLGGRANLTPTIPRIVKQFKGSITKQTGFSIWQKSYYDHVIRDEQDYQIKSNYIAENPAKWLHDEYY